MPQKRLKTKAAVLVIPSFHPRRPAQVLELHIIMRTDRSLNHLMRLTLLGLRGHQHQQGRERINEFYCNNR